MDLNELWNEIVNYEISNDDELRLVTDINGYNEETLNDVIYARTGCRDIEQFLEEIEE